MLGLKTLDLFPRKGLFDQPLDFLQLRHLVGAHQGQRDARLSRTACPPDAVNVIFRDVRQIKVHDPG